MMIARRRFLKSCGLMVALGTSGALGRTAWAKDHPGSGEPCRVTVVFDITGKFDKSFGESAWNGARRAKKNPQIRVRELEAETPALRAQTVRVAAEGADLVVTVGQEFASAVQTVAKEFPKVRFTAIEAEAVGENIQSIHFREQEGGYLAGVAAALKSRSGILGFVGGAPIPSVTRFLHGFIAGAHSVNSQLAVLTSMAPSTGADTFRDPYAGYAAAQSLMNQGADVIFAAAGATGLGAYQAVADRQRFSIGVDTDQTYLFPGSMLTSVVKHVDGVVEHAAATCHSRLWSSGFRDLGVADWSISLALGPQNLSLMSADLQSRLEDIREGLVDGRVIIPPQD